jgi:hypothetical protein
LLALFIAMGIPWRDCECPAKGRWRQPDRQVDIGHQQACTDRRCEIHWVDFAHVPFLRTF